MKIIVFGDIHGTWGPVERIAKHELPERGVILSVGDLCNYRFEVVGDRTFVFVWGNHESDGYLQQKTADQKPIYINYFYLFSYCLDFTTYFAFCLKK